MAEDLLVLAQPLARLYLEPARVALVQLRSEPLRHRVIGRVADQDVAEAERVVAGELGLVGADQVLADE